MALVVKKKKISAGKESAFSAGDLGSISVVGKIPWRREWHHTPVFLPEESHGWRTLAGVTVHGVTRSWTRLKWLSTHTRSLHLESFVFPGVPKFSSDLPWNRLHSFILRDTLWPFFSLGNFLMLFLHHPPSPEVFLLQGSQGCFSCWPSKCFTSSPRSHLFVTWSGFQENFQLCL